MHQLISTLNKKKQRQRRFNSRSNLECQYVYETDILKDKKGRQWVLLLLLLLAVFFVLSNGTGFQGEYTIDSFQFETQDETVSRSFDDDPYDLTTYIPHNNTTEENTEINAATSSESEAVTHSRRQRLQETNVDKYIEKVVQANSDEMVHNTLVENSEYYYKYNTLPICKERGSTMPAQININASISSLPSALSNPMVMSGGRYKPTDCHSKDTMAILVPYRNRPINLSTFLVNIHAFLITQNLEYRIFVIQQYDTGTLNKGSLLNAGFKEIQKHGRWRCVILHDVDLLPLSPSNLYSCPSSPRHMSSLVLHPNITKHNTSSTILFGGVTAMLLEHYKMANGHSNAYWGRGGEDYVFIWRLRAAGLKIVRNSPLVGRYLSLPHNETKGNLIRYRLLETEQQGRWQCEGLNTLQYRVVSATSYPLYTHLVIKVYRLGKRRRQPC